MRFANTSVLGVALVAVSAVSCTTKQRYVERANALVQERKYDDALINYRKAIQKDPNYGEAFYRLGLCELERGEPLRAFEALSTATQIMPDNDSAKAALADILVSIYILDVQRPKPLYDKINAIATELLAKDSSSFDGLRLKGYIAAADRKYDKAIALFQKADHIRANDAKVLTALSHALLSSGKSAEGVTLASRVIHTYPTQNEPYDLLYRHYRSNNKSEEAAGILQLKVKNNPQRGEDVIDLARHYVAMQNNTEVVRTIRRLTDNPRNYSGAYVLAGQFYTAVGQPQEAIHYYQECVGKEPGSKADCQKNAAVTLMLQGQLQEAMPWVDAVLKEHPKDEDALQLHAALLMGTKKPADLDKSIQELETLLKDRPAKPPLRFALGQALMRKGDIKGARQQYETAVKADPTFAPGLIALAEAGLFEKRPQAAIQYADQLLQLQPGNNRAKVLRAAGLSQLERYEEARDQLDRVIAVAPKYADAQLQLAWLHLMQKRYQQAEAIFQKFYTPGKSQFQVVSGLVQVRLAQNNGAAATQLLNEEIQKAPDATQARIAFASVAAHTGKVDLAMNQYKYLLDQHPAAAELHRRLGDVYQQSGDLPNALASYRKAFELQPNDPTTNITLAKTLETAGNKIEAIQHYKRTLEADPHNAPVLNNVAFLIADTGGNLEEALTAINTARQQRPNDPIITDTLGWIYLKKRMTTEAIHIFANLADKYPTNSTFRYHHAMALIARGEKNKAKTELTAAVNSNPSARDLVGIKELLEKVN